MHVTLLSLLLYSMTSVALEPSTGAVSIFVFNDGRPLQKISVEVEGQIHRASDGGMIFLELTPGQKKFLLRSANKDLANFTLQVMDSKNIEVVVTVKGGKTNIDYEGVAPTAHTSRNTEAKREFHGRLVSLESNMPVSGASIFIRGYDGSAVSDRSGNFSILAPIGNQLISIVHKDFSIQTEKVIVGSVIGEKVTDFTLAPAAIDLGDFVVLAPHVQGSIAALIEERKNASSVKDVIGSEQMSKSGDGTAAAALKRVTGLSLVGGKYVYVRGLGERYSSTILNGAQIPSPDPNRRVVPMDMIPSSIIQSMAIQKSYTPENPAEFGGGSIQIRTKNSVEKSHLKVSISAKTRPGQTGQQTLGYTNNDSFGFSGSDRKMPNKLDDATGGSRELRENNPPLYNTGFSDAELKEIAGAIRKNYDLKKVNLPPGYGVSVSGGSKLKIKSSKMDLLFGLDYADDWKTSQTDITNYDMAPTGLIYSDSYRRSQTLNSTKLAGILAFGGKYKKGHSLDAMIMVSRNSSNLTQTKIGEDREGAKQVNLRRFIERQLRVYQLSSKHKLTERVNIHWQLTAADAKSLEPDKKEDTFIKPDGSWMISTEGVDNTISWSTLNDESQEIQLGASWQAIKQKQLNAKLSIGFGSLERDRKFAMRRFGFFGKEGLVTNSRSTNKVYSHSEIRLKEKTINTDNYFASQSVQSCYASASGAIFEDFQYLIGSRLEESRQKVTTFLIFDPTNKVNSDLKTRDILPVVNLAWLISDKTRFRLGYSETISRPDFKELSPASFKDDRFDRFTKGDRALRSTIIDNIDARFEWYRRSNESLSIGFFQKAFDKPIEITIEPGASGEVTFKNAKSAINRGIEFEFRNQLTRDLNFSGNLSWINSKIEIDPSQQASLTSTSRPLQGQSPYIYNFQIGYDNESSRFSANLLYNVFGRRIFLVGTNGAPDIYEQPFEQVDLVLSKKILKSSSVKLKLQNLIDPDSKYKQGEKVRQIGKKGRSISLSYSSVF